MDIRKPDNSAIQDYQRWEKVAAFKTGVTRYLDYAPGKPVFSIRGEDVPEQAGPVSCQPDEDGELILTYTTKETGDEEFSLNLFWDFTDKDVVACLDLVDGRRSIDDIIRISGGTPDAEICYKLLSKLAGSFILLPAVINKLEQKLSFNGIVRFPIRSRYSLLREYWENQSDVRLALADLPAALDSASSFKSFLSGLHIIATLGSGGRNYYGGGGGIPTTPGEYRNVPVNTRVPEAMVRFIHNELAGSGYDYDPDDYKTIRNINGRIVGELLNSGMQHNHQYESSTGMDVDIEELRESLVDVTRVSGTGNREIFIAKLSYFHWLFAHAHPFTNINNSIAMNLVNWYLEKEEIGFMPHMFLDYIAQRTGHVMYEDIFSGYVATFSFGTGSGQDTACTEKIREYYNNYLAVSGKIPLPAQT